MINNEFNCIGIATSEYERDNWGNCTLKLEIEKMGSKEGNVFEAEFKVYGNNRMVDVNRSVLGEQVAVNGYIDYFTSKKGVPVLRLVAQRVYVLGEQKRRLSEARTSGYYPDPKDAAPQEEASPVQPIGGEDDLPF
jgi:hypothetical protein